MWQNRSIKNQPQQGFVSIIVAGLVMIILGLITIGFARVMQREQRQAFDRQLSRQALYAAETGINDIFSSITSNPNLPNEKDECDLVGDLSGIDGNPVTNPAKNGGLISGDRDVSYTCALYDKTPQELNYDVAENSSEIVELASEGGETFKSLVFQWGSSQLNTNDVNSLPVCGDVTFPASRSNVPVLRIDLTDISGAVSRDGLANSTDNLYLLPCRSGSASENYSFKGSDSKKPRTIPCLVADPSKPCRVNIDSGLTGNRYLLRMRSIYSGAIVTVSGTRDTVPDVGPRPIEFSGAQTSIDVTARASDIVRRLRVSIPVKSVDGAPEAVFQSFGGVCKLVTVDRSRPGDPEIGDSCY